AADAGKLVLSYIQPDARLVADPDLKGADVTVVLGTDFAAIVKPTAGTTAGGVTFGITGGAGGLTPAPIAGATQLRPPAPNNPPRCAVVGERAPLGGGGRELRSRPDAARDGALAAR